MEVLLEDGVETAFRESGDGLGLIPAEGAIEATNAGESAEPGDDTIEQVRDDLVTVGCVDKLHDVGRPVRRDANVAEKLMTVLRQPAASDHVAGAAADADIPAMTGPS